MLNFQPAKYYLFIFFLLIVGTILAKSNPAQSIVIINDDTRTDNRVRQEANSGRNKTDAGEIKTGQAQSNGVITNIVNTNIIKNCCGTPPPGPSSTPAPSPTSQPTSQPSQPPTTAPTPTSQPNQEQPNNNGGVGGWEGASVPSAAGEVLGLAATSSKAAMPLIFPKESFLNPVKIKPDFWRQQLNPTALPTRILIPAQDIDLAISQSQIRNGYWEVAPTEASYGLGSGYPGETGNTVIFAHARPGLFVSLPDLRVNDKISLLANYRWYHYRVQMMATVSTNEIELIKPTIDETLTLFTCAGSSDNQRFVVVAKPER